MTQSPQKPSPSLVGEFKSFLVHNKKWYLVPLIVLAVLIGALVLSKSSALSPYIYPLF
jgi:hypothetical protein